LANITGRSQRHLLFLASYQAVTVPLFGQGKVGADEGAPAVDYQLSQRADFCRYKLLCENTMHPHRPLVNTRDESHCGHPDFRRLHVIAYDNSLAQVTCVLKVGLMQIALAMIEAGEMPDHLVLANPLEALVLLSHDPTLQVKAPRVTGGPVTAPEWFDLFVAAAHRFAADGKLEGIVPDWTLILRLAAETAGHLLKRHFPELARRLDSFLKLAVLQEAMKLHGLDWQSPAIRMLDQLYASLGDDGLFWQYEKAGLVETLVPEENIARFQHSAPADTRASIRAKLLELIPPAHLVAVDWGRVVFDMTDKDQKSRRVSISLTSPAEFLQPGSALARATSFDELTAISTSQSSHPIHEAPREEAAENSPALPS
jgi:proteasome accessory factor A